MALLSRRRVMQVLAAAGFLPAAAGRIAAGETREESKARYLAMTAVRFLNTAERRYHCAHGRYLPLSELAKTEELRTLRDGNGKVASAGKLVSLIPNTDLVPGFTLDLVVTPGGDHYCLLLNEKTSADHFCFASDQAGVIYEGLRPGRAPVSGAEPAKSLLKDAQSINRRLMGASSGMLRLATTRLAFATLFLFQGGVNCACNSSACAYCDNSNPCNANGCCNMGCDNCIWCYCIEQACCPC